jgi:hypothetical protein
VLGSWRLPHWLVLGAIGLYVAAYAGVLPSRHDVLAWFASRPEVADAFNDPAFGRADALILVFSTLFLGPFALLLAVVGVIFVLAVLGGVALPVVRWFSLPDWTATALVVLGLALLGWLQSHVWLPGTLWFVALLARACRIVLT